MRDVNITSLNFPMVEYGKRVTPWDLVPLLYKGGARALANKAKSLIEAEALGPLIKDRIDLVQKIHGEMSATLVGGGSWVTTQTLIHYLRNFFGYADDEGLSMNMKTVSSSYIKWTDHLLNRVRVVNDLSEASAYNYGHTTGQILDKVLERTSPILLTTRLTNPPERKRIRSVEADKQRLDETFEFGFALLDIVEALHLKALWGPLGLFNRGDFTSGSLRITYCLPPHDFHIKLGGNQLNL